MPQSFFLRRNNVGEAQGLVLWQIATDVRAKSSGLMAHRKQKG